MERVGHYLGWAALVAGIALPVPFPEIANISTLVLMGIGVLVLAFVPGRRRLLGQPAISLMLLGGAVLLVAVLLTARSLDHVAAIFILAPLWFAVGTAALLAGLGRGLTLTAIGLAALTGALAGALVTGWDGIVFGNARGGMFVNNPIHIADLSLTLGFLALVGLFSDAKWRWVFLAGPLLALVAIYFSGSRGPLVAFLPMAGFAMLFLIFALWKGTRLVPWLVVLTVAGLAVGSLFAEVEIGGRTLSVRTLVTLEDRSGAVDHSAGERVTMLSGAWGAFNASPIYGHGLIDFTAPAMRYGPADNPYTTPPHLHNDLADFAVIGGILGLLCYGLIMAAPIAGAARARGQLRPALLYAGIVTSIGYLAMGLTNAMIGILTQTTVFAVIAALIAALAFREDGRGNDVS